VPQHLWTTSALGERALVVVPMDALEAAADTDRMITVVQRTPIA
jgi:hypothetical protein